MIKLSEISGLMIDRKILDLPDEDIETFISGFNDAIFTQGQKLIGLNRERLAKTIFEYQMFTTRNEYCKWDDLLSKGVWLQEADAIIAAEKELFEVKE